MPLSSAATTALISGAASLIGGGMNMAFQGAKNNKQWKYQKKAMELQNQMNIDNWNMQNEYNSPVAQMSRFQDAGLNPNLIYGQGNSNTGNATSAPEAVVATKQAPQFEVKGIQNLASTILQERAIKSQEEVNQAHINLLRQQAISESMSHTSRLINDINNQLESYKRTGDMKMFWDTYEDKKRALGLQNENLVAQTALTDVTIEKTKAESNIARYNLDVQLPLQSSHLRRQLRKLDDEHAYQKLMNFDLSNKVKSNEKIYGINVEQANTLLEKAKEEVTLLKQKYNLNNAEALLSYLTSLNKYDLWNYGITLERVQNFYARFFEVNLYSDKFIY